MKIRMGKGFKQFLWKTVIFVLAFIVFSFIMGLTVFSNDLLTKWKIEIYGGVGYILLFLIAGFILLYRKRLTKLEMFKRERDDYILLANSVMLLGVFYGVSNYIDNLMPTIFNIIWFHFLALSGFVSLMLGVYGVSFTNHFVKKFKKELFYFLIFGIIVYVLINLI